jgi:hypothetical protein
MEHTLVGGVSEESLRHTNRTMLVVGGHPEGSGQGAYQALYRGECPARQQPDPDEAFAAMLSEPHLPNAKPDRPEAEHQAPRAAL